MGQFARVSALLLHGSWDQTQVVRHLYPVSISVALRRIWNVTWDFKFIVVIFILISINYWPTILFIDSSCVDFINVLHARHKFVFMNELI